jgi:hypothetical protein
MAHVGQQILQFAENVWEPKRYAPVALGGTKFSILRNDLGRESPEKVNSVRRSGDWNRLRQQPNGLNGAPEAMNYRQLL